MQAHLRSLLLAAIVLFLPAAPLLTQPTRVPVLVELFTSEGCSSCPPADALLGTFDRDQPVPNADIIVLGEHVDYWDYLGWRDRFSSPELTARQKEYQAYFKLDDIYTPQFIVNGEKQFNGSNTAAILAAIRQSSAKTVRLRFTGVRVERDTVTFALEAGTAEQQNVDIYAALVDPEDTTSVPTGENGGRTLHHVGVVRWLGRIGSSWHMQKLGERSFSIQAKLPDYSTTIRNGPGTSIPMTNGMRLVVFAQVKPVGPILGIASCTLPTSGTAPSGALCPPAGLQPSTPQ